jgi:hypothetical protein
MSMMAALRCERYSAFGNAQQTSPCDIGEIIWKPEDDKITRQDIAEQLEGYGWVTVDGKHYCRRHNPAEVGITWKIEYDIDNYHEIPGTGYEVRYLSGYDFELRRIRTDAT